MKSPIHVIFFDAAETLFHINGSVADIYLTHAVQHGFRQTPDSRTLIAQAFQRAFHDASPPVFAAKLAEVRVFGLRLRASMVAGHVGDQLQLTRLAAREVAVDDQMIAVLVVLIVVDQVAHVLQPRGGFQ